jgi:hypothetical protein
MQFRGRPAIGATTNSVAVRSIRDHAPRSGVAPKPTEKARHQTTTLVSRSRSAPRDLVLLVADVALEPADVNEVVTGRILVRVGGREIDPQIGAVVGLEAGQGEEAPAAGYLDRLGDARGFVLKRLEPPAAQQDVGGASGALSRPLVARAIRSRLGAGGSLGGDDVLVDLATRRRLTRQLGPSAATARSPTPTVPPGAVAINTIRAANSPLSSRRVGVSSTNTTTARPQPGRTAEHQ